jgi:hypothetical protein
MKLTVAAAIVAVFPIVRSPTEVGRHAGEHVGSGFSRTSSAQQTAPARSVWDGVYTLAQAKRGALKSGLCVTCHGDEFRGDPAPDLAGPDFLIRWDGRTLGDLFDLIRLTMPDDDPGALPREQYADLVAYILAVNKLPIGSTEIGIDPAPLKQIRILATKP